MREQVGNFITGGAGIATSEIVSNVDVPASADTSEIVKVVVQLIIGIATLLGLVKKKNK